MIIFVKKPEKAQTGNKLKDTAYLEAVNDALSHTKAFDQNIINNAPGYDQLKERWSYADNAALNNSSTNIKTSDIQNYVPWADPEKVKRIMKEQSSEFNYNIKGTTENSKKDPLIGYRSVLKNPSNIIQHFNSAQDTTPYKEEMLMYEPEGGFYETLDVTDTPVERYRNSGKTNRIINLIKM